MRQGATVFNHAPVLNNHKTLVIRVIYLTYKVRDYIRIIAVVNRRKQYVFARIDISNIIFCMTNDLLDWVVRNTLITLAQIL